MKKENKKSIKVSVCCFVYNQELYVREMLDSIVCQKTNFDFEVLVHDDCSTDKTIEILKEYEKKYPNLVKVIYEKENQYSQGKKLIPISLKYCKGKYIALCEGDDYWCDELKLQKQYDFLENNKGYSLVTNACYLEDVSTKTKKRKKMPKSTSDYTVEEIILGDGGLFATNSMFFPKKIVSKLPDFYLTAPIGDYPLTMFLALNGNVYYLKDIMSVYRVNAIGSWSLNQNKGDLTIQKQKATKLNERLYDMFEKFNSYTNNQYINYTKKFMLNKEYILHVNYGDINKVKHPKYKELYSFFCIKGKVKLFIIRKLTFIYKLIKKVMR